MPKFLVIDLRETCIKSEPETVDLKSTYQPSNALLAALQNDRPNYGTQFPPRSTVIDLRSNRWSGCES
jgi:hypothetical protein